MCISFATYGFDRLGKFFLSGGDRHGRKHVFKTRTLVQNNFIGLKARSREILIYIKNLIGSRKESNN